MTQLTRFAVPAVVGALLLAGLGMAPAQASPAPSLAPVPSITAAEIADAQTVANFAATHPAPVVTSSDPATFAAESQAAVTYWKAAPVEALFGQYGCTVTGKSVGLQTGDDGVARATFSWKQTCPSGVDSSSIGLSVAPRAAALAEATRLSGASSLGGISPMYQVTNCSGVVSSGKHCIGMETTTGLHTFLYQWLGSGNISGHVRAGQGVLSGCSNGTFIANTPDVTLSNGQGTSLGAYIFVSTGFSNSFYTPAGTLRTRYCATM